jgi:chromosome segregation ATPase
MADRGSISDNLRRSFANQNYDFLEEKNPLQSDKNCAVCQTTFGIIGIVNAKKHFCRFCQSAVCAKCSPTKLKHPESKKSKRICSNCVNKLIGSNVSQDCKNEIENCKSEKEQLKQELDYKIKEKQLEIAHNQATEEIYISELRIYEVKIKDLQKSIDELFSSQEEIRQNYSRLSQEYKNYTADIEKKNSTIQTLEKNYQTIRGIYDNNKSLLPSLRNTLDKLLDEEFKIKGKIKEKISNARSLSLSDKEQKMSEDLDELNNKNYILKQEITIFDKEIQELSQKNLEIDEKLSSREVKHRTASMDTLATNSGQKFSLEEENRIKELRDQSRENQKTIQSLRASIEEKNTLIKKKDFDGETDPGSRPCAKCSII